ncbi:hypothetical protein SteCoe_16060 [Stentor coeruleus]|uniref:Uncharacterized protein n=1 Tax=Stentor coeruleus TaxID=5963 RepID=A0A1R2C278_9CILI|nr:hypothetical protein SteCoe_16060 [Stentor coeruleus]
MDEELLALEKIVYDSNFDDAIKILPASSHMKKYLEGTRLIETDPNSERLTQLLEQLSEANSEYYTKLQFRKLLKDYDSTENPEIITEINEKITNFNVDHPPPCEAQIEEAEKLPDTLKIEFPDLNEAAKNLKSFNNLTNEGKFSISINKTSDSVFKKFLTVNHLYRFKDLPERFVSYFQKTTDFTESACFTSMTKDQLNKIVSLEPKIWKNLHFLKSWISKEFFLKALSMKTEQKYEYFKFISGEIEQDPKFPPSFKSVIFFNIICLGYSLEIYDESWFIKYLSCHKTSKIYKTNTLDEQEQKEFSCFIINTSLSENTVIENYVKNLLERKGQIFDILSKHLIPDFLKKIKANIDLLKGEPIEKIDKKYLDNELLNAVYIEPCMDNPKEFTRKELVKFSMRIKNISRLLVRVLELNPKNYYLKKNKEITTDIVLDGLVAKYEFSYEFIEPPQVEIKKLFEFPQLSSKETGIFIIEFFGNGKHSRVLIKKGSLRYVTKPTASGHVIYILNEDNELCKNAGVYLDSRYYEAKGQDGRIDIPFAETAKTKTLILCNEDQAELVQKFSHMTENYSLHTVFFLHEEQVIRGRSVKLLIKPRILVNGIRAPNGIVKNAEVDIRFTFKNESPIAKSIRENGKTYKCFNNLEMPEGAKPIEILFDIPNNALEIKATLTVTITTIKGQEESFDSSYKQNLAEASVSESLFDAYLNYSDNTYFIEIKGKNGEPINNQRVEVKARHAYWNQEESQTLCTNSDGKIILGTLSGIINLSAKILYDENEESGRDWSIRNFREKIDYPKDIKLCEGDEFVLPIKSSDKNKEIEDIFWFYSIYGDVVGDGAEKFLKLDKENCTVSLGKIEVGNYEMVFKGTYDKIKISVVEGVHFGKNFILQDNSAVTTSRDYTAIGISKVLITKSEITAQVSGHFDEKSSVYALFFNYLTSSLISSAKSLSDLNEIFSTESFSFTSPQNIYLPSALLDQEYQYVLDRKKQAKFVGNMLDKPQVVLKRHFIKETITEVQEAQKGTELEKKTLGKTGAKKKKDRISTDSSAENEKTMHYVNFLCNPAVWMCTDVVDGKAKFKIPGVYSNVLFVAYNTSSYAYRIRCLNKSSQIKDLRYNQGLTQSIETFKCEFLNINDNLVISNLPTSSIEIVDTFDKFFTIRMSIQDNYGDYIDSSIWKAICHWDTMTFDEKINYYNSQSSHELHLFLYTRDKDFFNSFARPFLENKVNKDVVDKFLCGEDLEEFKSFSIMSTLNSLEKMLLGLSFKEKDPDFAMRIINILRSERDYQDENNDWIVKVIKSVLKIQDLIEIDYYGEEEHGGGGGGGEGGGDYRRRNVEGCAGVVEDEDEEGEEEGEEEKQKVIKSQKVKNDEDEEDDLVLEAREKVPTYYKKMGETSEYSETYYYDCRDKPENLSSSLYGDIGLSLLQEIPFFNPYLLDIAGPLIDFISLLSFCPLPFKAEKHQFETEGESWHMIAQSPSIVFYKTLSKAEFCPNSKIALSSKYSSKKNNYEQEKEVTQFIKQKIYTCKVVITNTSSKYVNLEIMIQIPQGSIALKPLESSKTYYKRLRPFSTSTIELRFYFPESGCYEHIPASVIMDKKIIAILDKKDLVVRESYDLSKLETFEDLVMSGRKDLVLEYMKTNNWNNKKSDYNLNSILWMCEDKDFWMEVIEMYRSKMIYNDELWYFGFMHCDKETVKDVLKKWGYPNSPVGCHFSSTLLTTQNEGFNHLEYDPLVNARAYRLANHPRIANTSLRKSYKLLLLYLVDKGILEDPDLLSICQYLIYQDRYQEAKEFYNKISLIPSKYKIKPGPMQIQYDYLTCYLDPENSEELANLYKDYPVSTWRKLFNDVTNIIKELECEDIPTPLNLEPSLNFEIKNNILEMVYENVDSCIVRIYEIDLEVLFSKNPFLFQDTQSFGYVKANEEIVMKLTGKNSSFDMEKYSGKNLLVEVDYKTYTVSKSHFSNLFVINCIERFGVIKVMDQCRNPKPAVYVKAFVKRKDGKVEFYKDGYTDVRGKFDYVSLNTDSLESIEKFSLLVVDDELGALIHEANAPPQ